MKRIVSMIVVAGLAMTVQAQVKGQSQTPSTQTSSNLRLLNEKEPSQYIPVFQYWKEHNILQHLDLSVTAGTTGIGIDVASPVGDYVQVRAGYEFMPRFEKTMKFDLAIGGQPARTYDSNGNRTESRFDRMKEFLYQFTGYDVEDHADMVGQPTINNFKFLIDVFPFKNNKHWHFTGGFYWGPSRFAKAVNSTESMVSLLSVGIYNSMYEKASAGQPLFDLEAMGVTGVSKDFPDELRDKFVGFGRMGFSLGTYKHDMVDANGVEHHAGESYIVEPGEDGTVRVKATSNAFKPYLGFGYGGRLLKNRSDWKVSFDCGAMFWGGSPNLYVHDGVNLTKDVENIGGKIGSYVKMFDAFKVYPVLSFRLTKTLF